MAASTKATIPIHDSFFALRQHGAGNMEVVESREVAWSWSKVFARSKPRGSLRLKTSSSRTAACGTQREELSTVDYRGRGPSPS
jgi:hypothetical protein